MTRLAGKHALVTGGSSGIGAAIAAALAADGAAVAACARRFAPGPPVQLRAGAVAPVHLDVTDERAVDAVFAALPALDIVVLSHGTGTFARIADCSLADVRAMLEVHVVGTLACMRAALRRRAGHVVVIGSHAVNHAFPECGGYTAAKAGQVALARVLAAEARAAGTRVTTVLPGATDTPIWDDRPDFDRSKMMQPAQLAGLVADVVARPEVAVDELVVTPPAGAL